MAPVMVSSIDTGVLGILAGGVAAWAFNRFYKINCPVPRLLREQACRAHHHRFRLHRSGRDHRLSVIPGADRWCHRSPSPTGLPTRTSLLAFGIYGVVRRSLIPFGLHHIWNAFLLPGGYLCQRRR